MHIVVASPFCLEVRCHLYGNFNAWKLPRHVLLILSQGGDLFSALYRESKNGTHMFDWSNRGKEVALGVASGLQFLHTKGVIHR